MEKGIGGAFVWSLAMDDFKGRFCGNGNYPLISHLRSLLGVTHLTEGGKDQSKPKCKSWPCWSFLVLLQILLLFHLFQHQQISQIVWLRPWTPIHPAPHLNPHPQSHRRPSPLTTSAQPRLGGFMPNLTSQDLSTAVPTESPGSCSAQLAWSSKKAANAAIILECNAYIIKYILYVKITEQLSFYFNPKWLSHFFQTKKTYIERILMNIVNKYGKALIWQRKQQEIETKSKFHQDKKKCMCVCVRVYWLPSAKDKQNVSYSKKGRWLSSFISNS